ncbi:MAG: deoxynucleoside kinase [Bacteroidetes bacterium]|nr:deoxynucleoside kinase [Bacteroidota bacterium]
MENTFPYSYIAIEGNIGAGKTTFCKMLERDFNCRLILEEFADNPFLPYFYENQERYAFPVELFFMTERHKQLQGSLAQKSLFQELIVSDYYFLKTLLFAKNTLNREEYRLFQRLFNILNASFPKPEILVYLHRSVKNLLSNIKNRGRSYEQDIQADYLTQIQKSYFDYFRTETSFPILIIDVENIDFWDNETYYHKLIESLQKNYSPGINRVSVFNE